MKLSDIRPEVSTMAERAEARLTERFRELDKIAEINTRKVMQAFQNHRVSDACFAGTTGYGYDDLGRETLDRIYAEIFGAEAALVRILAKLILLPFIVGITYELNRWVGRHDENGFARAVAWPGKQIQHITTNEPDDSMIEVAIEAVKLVIPEVKGSDIW